MILLQIKTYKKSDRYGNLGIKIDDQDIIEVNSVINARMMTHFEQNSSNKNNTDIYLTNGSVLTTPIPWDRFMVYLVKLLSHAESGDSDDLIDELGLNNADNAGDDGEY